MKQINIFPIFSLLSHLYLLFQISSEIQRQLKLSKPIHICHTFNSRLNGLIERQTTNINMGVNPNQEYEQDEQQIQDCVHKHQQLKVKQSIDEPELVDLRPGIPQFCLYHTIEQQMDQSLSTQKPVFHPIYLPTDADWDFIDENEIDVDQFVSYMTIYDLMFPAKYRNLQIDISHPAYDEIQKAMKEIIKNPQKYGVQTQICTNMRYDQSLAQIIYQHFLLCRELNNHYPLLMHLSPDHTKINSNFYFKEQDKQISKNTNTIKKMRVETILLTALAEYVVARELTNCWHVGQMYFDKLNQNMDQPQNEEIQKYVSQNLYQTLDMLENAHLLPLIPHNYVTHQPTQNNYKRHVSHTILQEKVNQLKKNVSSDKNDKPVGTLVGQQDSNFVEFLEGL